MARRGSFRIAMLALIVVAITTGLALRGWSFYVLSAEDRVDHPDFRELRPSGNLGNGFGWIAAMLIVLNLAYLIRRRFGGFGKMQTWLDLHVFTGLTAATLVSFHSAFQLRTPIAAASTLSLLLVVVTGLVGRFLFVLAPAGARERLAAALDAIDAALPGHRDALAAALATHPGPTVAQNATLVRSLVAVPGWLRAGRARRRMIDSILTTPRTREHRLAVHELRSAATSDARISGVSALLRSWRGLHRLFALVMLAAVLLHGGVAWYYGYRWIFA